MARIRTIKPEFWSSPSMRNANPWARLLFIAMWNWADDSGRGTANVRELAAFAFPDDEDDLAPTAAELPSLLAEVRGRWGVIFYEADGRRYYAIPSWEDHQRNERKAASRHPAPADGKEYDPNPPDQGKRDDRRTFTEVPPHSDGTTAPADGGSGPGTGEQGNRGTASSSENAEASTDEERPDKNSRDDIRRLCTRLLEHLKANGVKKLPDTPAKKLRWLDAARLLLDRDERPFDEALALIDWCQNDDFWKGNIHSMPTFREQYDKLRLKAVAKGEHLRVVPDLPTNPADLLAELRARGDAQAVANLAGAVWVEEPKPPSDPTPAEEWSWQQRIQFIDSHAAAAREALERKAG